MPFVLPGVVKIPRANTFVEGAMLEPVNTVLKAVNRLKLLPGDVVLVAGQGPIGLMFTRLLTLRRVSVFATDVVDSRVKLARCFGAQWASDAVASGPAGLLEAAQRATRARGFDAAIVTVPLDEVVKQAQDLVRCASQVLLFAHTRRGVESSVDFARICVDEKDLIGSYSSDFLLQRKVARLVFSRQLNVRALVTHELPLDRTAEAIHLASQPQPSTLKIVVSQASSGN
jgi:L-iditol 2-dehydrogenase